jgi:hypothetical protein
MHCIEFLQGVSLHPAMGDVHQNLTTLTLFFYHYLTNAKQFQ